ncbi:MAG: serine hydrolase [Planctomycetes bacterium]|nr:serine hydrolase [Planctomycetota bacterium]
MPRLLPALTLSLLLCATVSSAADKETRTVAKGKLGKRIVEWAKSAEAAGFSGVVFAAKKGTVIAAVGVGSADLEGERPNTPATRFEIASATKQFTAAAVMILVDKKKIDLDASISTYLPGVPANCKSITVRHLLQHTSGIPGTNSEGSGTDLARVLPGFLKGGPKHKPGTHWEYWNQGYALLTEIVARTAGQSYVDVCKAALFRPCGMKASGFTGDTPPKGASVAIGRSSDGPSRSAYEHPYGGYGFQYRGMGGAVTTAWDLWRWHNALSGKLLSKRARRELFKPGLNDYALGWFVKESKGRLVQSHGGGVRGFICDVRRYPKQDACVFVLCNNDAAPLGVVAQGVEQLLFGEKLTVSLPRPADPKDVAALSGTYRDAGGNVLKVGLEGKTLEATLTWTGGQVTYLVVSRKGRALKISDGSDTYDLSLGALAKGKASSLSFGKTRYSRAAD